jgi:hypothetical protein
VLSTGSSAHGQLLQRVGAPAAASGIVRHVLATLKTTHDQFHKELTAIEVSEDGS